MCKYPLIDRYERFRKISVGESTAKQATEKLERIFDVMTEKFGVVMTDTTVTGLNTFVLTDWYDYIQEGRKVTTINNYVCMLNPFLRWLKDMEVLEKDMSHLLHTAKLPDPMEMPPDERPKDKYLTHEQARALLECKTGYNLVRDHAIIALFLFSGLRTSELCSLKIGSIVGREKGTIECKRKGGKWAIVHVAEDAYPYIERYLRTRSDRDNMDAPLFMTTHNMPCSRKQIYKVLAYKQESLGIAKGGHALRHTFVSEMEKAGGVAVARDAANHKNIRVTSRYDHATADQIHDAVNKLNW